MDIVKEAIRAVERNLELAKAVTTPEEFQTVLQWLADYVTVNRSSERG